MKARRFVLVVLVYVSLDLGNCWMPGAFNFDPDASVDGIPTRSIRTAASSAVTSAPPLAVAATPSAPAERAAVRREPVREPRDWATLPRRAQHTSLDAPPPPEAH